ncbi:MAG: RDD family protein [Halococcoides sp.]
MSQSSWEPDRDDTDVIGARIGAQLIDSIIMVAIIFVPMIVLGALGGLLSAKAGGLLSTLGLIVGIVGSLGYRFLIEGLWEGYTVGKRIFGIKVVEEDGSECSLGSAIIRNVFEFIDGLFYYLVGFIAIAISDKRQRVGDRIGGTVVVRESDMP